MKLKHSRGISVRVKLAPELPIGLADRYIIFWVQFSIFQIHQVEMEERKVVGNREEKVVSLIKLCSGEEVMDNGRVQSKEGE